MAEAAKENVRHGSWLFPFVAGVGVTLIGVAMTQSSEAPQTVANTPPVDHLHPILPADKVDLTLPMCDINGKIYDGYFTKVSTPIVATDVTLKDGRILHVDPFEDDRVGFLKGVGGLGILAKPTGPENSAVLLALRGCALNTQPDPTAVLRWDQLPYPMRTTR